MNSRQLGLGLLLSLAFACQKKSASAASDSEAQQAVSEVAGDTETKDAVDTAAAAEPATANDFLVGRWLSDCVNQPGSLQASVVLQYDFKADGTASTKTLSYAQANCSKRFTKSDVDLIKEQINADRLALGQAPLNAAEAAPYENLWFPTLSPFQFTLGKTLKDATIEMNTKQKVVDQDVNSYLVIFMNEGSLYFAETCTKADLDGQMCERIVGDSVKNRARDMSEAIAFRKM